MSRLGPEQARVAAMLLLTLRGTPTIYQGEEIGMSDVAIPRDKIADPWERNVPGLGLGRDPVRTPLPWDAGPHGGFTSGEPWLPLGPDHRAVNVAAQMQDRHSMLSLYRALLALRRREEALVSGAWGPMGASEQVLAFERRSGTRALAIALNLSDTPSAIAIAGKGTCCCRPISIGLAAMAAAIFSGYGRMKAALSSGFASEPDRRADGSSRSGHRLRGSGGGTG